MRQLNNGLWLVEHGKRESDWSNHVTWYLIDILQKFRVTQYTSRDFRCVMYARNLRANQLVLYINVDRLPNSSRQKYLRFDECSLNVDRLPNSAPQKYLRFDECSLCHYFEILSITLLTSHNLDAAFVCHVTIDGMPGPALWGRGCYPIERQKEKSGEFLGFILCC